MLAKVASMMLLETKKKNLGLQIKSNEKLQNCVLLKCENEAASLVDCAVEKLRLIVSLELFENHR